MNSLKKHISENRNIYLAAGGLLAAAAAGYYLTKKGGSLSKPKVDYFPKEYECEAGISKQLSQLLGKAFKGGIDYDLKLWIQPDENRFKGIAEISFVVDPEFKEDLYLSAHNLEVYHIKINDKKIKEDYFSEIVETQKGYLYLANRHFHGDFFKITVKYTGEFGSTYGLLQYSDIRSKTGESYAFASTNILGASAIYPVFESPEVRALFRLAVAVPKGWSALSNEKSDDPVALLNEFGKEIHAQDPKKEDFHLFKFRQTKSIPFNALNIAGGKFTEHKSKTSVLGRKVNVYSLASEAGTVSKVTDHIGKIVKSTITRIEKLTNIKYPFTKCDILVLPEDLIFPSIFALNPIKVNREFPGLTSIYLRDYYNFKAEFVFELVASLVRIWFGNYVAVEWWSQLWFTEAFSRYLALRILAEDPKDYDLEDDDIHNLNFWLKSQAIYHETQNDVTFSNTSLIQDDVVNSFDAIFLAQNKAEKVGLFKLEELFSFYNDDIFTKVISNLLKDNAYKSINYMAFEVGFMAEIEDTKIFNNLKGCFNYKFVDDVKFSRTSEKVLTVQRITKDASDASKNHLIEVVFLTKSGGFIERKTEILKDYPITFQLDSEVYTFISVMKGNGIYYEDYDNDELNRIFEVLRDNKQMDKEYRTKAGRILLSNILRSKTLRLSEGLTHLKTLLTACSTEEQKWVVRSFAVIAKHIDRTKETAGSLRDFCSFLIGLARHNYEIVPYLGFFGVFDAACKDEVCEFIKDYNQVAKFDPSSSLLNYDLLKSSILMVAFLKLDVERAYLFSALVSTRDGAIGSILHRLIETHFEDMAGEHLKVVQDLKKLFINKPNYENGLEYYFKSLLLRTEKTAEAVQVKEFLTQVQENPEEHYVGGTKSFTHYNIAKILSTAKREEAVVEQEMDLSPGVDAMVARRFKHHFKLS